MLNELGISPLLTQSQTLSMARRTLGLTKSAHRRGDLRLTVSRGLTAVIQATVVAARTNNAKTILQADNIIQEAREILQGVIVQRAAAKLRKMG
jgi:hypothetical protein